MQTNANAQRDLDTLTALNLGDARPASMLLVIPQLVRPDFLVGVEIAAAKEKARHDTS